MTCAGKLGTKHEIQVKHFKWVGHVLTIDTS